jgi:hypothetical protein
VKFVKLLTVPAVLLASLALAVPASAHHLLNATVNVACQSDKVCVTLSGNIARDTDERKVVFDLFAKDSSTKLDEITFDVPAFDANGNNAFNQTLCFKVVTDNVPGFVVKVVKVTDVDNKPADLVIQLTSSEIVFSKYQQTPVVVGDTATCGPVPSPTPSPTPSHTPSPTPSATPSASPSPTPSAPPTPTPSSVPSPSPSSSGGSGGGTPESSPTPAAAVALAQTGGFDFRYPLVGLVILVAGAVLYFVSVSRRRSASRQ